MNLGNFKLDARTIIIGILILVGIVLAGRQLLGGNTDNVIPQLDQDASQNSDIEIGQLVSASSIDAQGCPVNVTTSFNPSDSVYIVAEDSNVVAGTDIFARLSRNGQPVEDSVLITANQDYVNTCIYLEFEATSGAEVLASGNYQAQMIVNGNPGPSVSFVVR